MGFQLLGPLRLCEPDGNQACLGGIKQRAALGFLLLHANQVVATSTLLDALWPQDKPVTARKMLQNAVSGLRSALRSDDAGESAILLTHSPGYLLPVDPEQVDLFRFRRLAEAGGAELADGAPQRAALLLPEALDLWQGRYSPTWSRRASPGRSSGRWRAPGSPPWRTTSRPSSPRAGTTGWSGSWRPSRPRHRGGSGCADS